MIVSRPPAKARLAKPIISSRVSGRPRYVAFVRALKKSSPGFADGASNCSCRYSSSTVPFLNSPLVTLKTWMPQPIQVSASDSGTLSR